jgi:hypothetical protein
MLRGPKSGVSEALVAEFRTPRRPREAMKPSRTGAGINWRLRYEIVDHRPAHPTHPLLALRLVWGRLRDNSTRCQHARPLTRAAIRRWPALASVMFVPSTLILVRPEPPWPKGNPRYRWGCSLSATSSNTASDVSVEDLCITTAHWSPPSGPGGPSRRYLPRARLRTPIEKRPRTRHPRDRGLHCRRWRPHTSSGLVRWAGSPSKIPSDDTRWQSAPVPVTVLIS